MTSNQTRIQRVIDILTEYWQSENHTLEKLSGDAGHRSYYRSLCKDVSIVVMDTKHPLNPAEDPFITVGRYLESCGLPVPGILQIFPDAGILLLQDLGDTTLQQRFQSDPDSVLHSEYSTVLNLLVQMHTQCPPDDPAMPIPVRSARFDFEKLRWELDFFLKHYVNDYLHHRLDAPSERILNNGFDHLCRSLDIEEPVVFTHRDFHCRNLMVTGNSVVIIDFQDARLGLPEYDLASLLRDAYVQLPEAWIEHFLDRYYKFTADTRNPEHRRSVFSLMCIQRNLKALGTFGYQTACMNNPHYIQYVPILRSHIFREMDHLESSDTALSAGFPDRSAFRSVIHEMLV